MLLQSRACQYLETIRNDSFLIEYEPMIKMAARKISDNHPILFEDLDEVGQMSFLRLLKDYDPVQHTEFEAYAMKILVADTIRLDRSPIVSEIAEAIGLTPEETIEVLAVR
jgi:RNA polymerase sigma-B factor